MSKDELLEKLESLETQCEEVIAECGMLEDRCRYLLYDIANLRIDCEGSEEND